MQVSRSFFQKRVLLLALALSWIERIAPAAIQLRIEQVQVGPESPSGLTIEARGNTVIIKELNFETTCCYIADARLEIRGSRISLRQRNVGDVCRCLGNYQLTYRISRLFPGEYDVTFSREDGTLSAVSRVTVDPILLQEGSDCGTPPDGELEVKIGVERDAVVIHHLNTVENTCLKLAAAVEVSGGTIAVREVDLGPPCNCVSAFDLLIEIPGLAPGQYVVELFDLRGKLAGRSPVTIAFPRLIATQAERPRNEEIPESDGVRVEGSKIVAERWQAFVQCCLDYQAEATVEGSTVTLRELDLGPPCDCIGWWNLRIEALDFDPGAWQVALQTLGGETLKLEVAVGMGRFVRGSISRDDLPVDISDALALLFHLFAWGEEFPCREAADVDDNGQVDVTDVIRLLDHLFADGPPPPAPYPLPGTETGTVDLGCLSPPCRTWKFTFDKPPIVPYDFVEFCIPAREELKGEVLAIYPEVTFLPGSHGRIGCSDDTVLSIIDWKDLDRSKLCALSLLEYIAEIRGSYYE